MGVLECAHEFYMRKGSGEREGGGQRKCMHKALWYLRSEDLSNLILVCDIRYAVVRAPISQGKAPKWHDVIHLTDKERDVSITALQRGESKALIILMTTLGNRGISETHGQAC